MNKLTIWVIVLIVAVFGGFVIYNTIQNSSNNIDYSQYDAGRIISDTANTGGIEEHVRGKADSEVVVVEYADFQCPGCASMMVYADKIYAEYKDKVAFVFRHYPVSYHQNARSAAAAAEAANKQGLFWEMADTLYNNRTDWMNETGSTRTDKFVELFQGIAPEGDVDKFKSDMNDKDFDKKINFDLGLGREVSKVDATPAFYVNGERVKILNSETLEQYAEKLENTINQKLAEKNLL